MLATLPLPEVFPLPAKPSRVGFGENQSVGRRPTHTQTHTTTTGRFPSRTFSVPSAPGLPVPFSWKEPSLSRSLSATFPPVPAPQQLAIFPRKINHKNKKTGEVQPRNNRRDSEPLCGSPRSPPRQLTAASIPSSLLFFFWGGGVLPPSSPKKLPAPRKNAGRARLEGQEKPGVATSCHASPRSSLVLFFIPEPGSSPAGGHRREAGGARRDEGEGKMGSGEPKRQL